MILLLENEIHMEAFAQVSKLDYYLSGFLPIYYLI
jgi:hypothetical protein